MSEYTRDDFYDISKLNIETRRKILIDAKEKGYDWVVNKLDCDISWSRQHIDMSFEEVMEKFDNSCHFVIIHRKGYAPKDQNDKDDIWRWKLEFGFSTMKGVSYYLFIYAEQEHLKYFIDTYKLKKMKS